MEVYKRKTREIVRSFLRHQRSFPDCIAALDAALADLIPRLKDGQLTHLRALAHPSSRSDVGQQRNRDEGTGKARIAGRKDATRLRVSA